jgi:hypothetical protein
VSCIADEVARRLDFCRGRFESRFKMVAVELYTFGFNMLFEKSEKKVTDGADIFVEYYKKEDLKQVVIII